MIAYVDGVLYSIFEDCAIVDVHGIGYNIFVSSNTLARLPSIGEHIRLYTYTCVREDAFLLYGFLNRNELDIFKKCITVSGIGPKGALSLLSALSVDELRYAILNEDAKKIAKAPGIGAKTAQRLILELKGKLDYKDDDIYFEINGNASSKDNLFNSNITEAIEALVALGYAQTDCTKAIKQIESVETMDSGAILKAALKYLF